MTPSPGGGIGRVLAVSPHLDDAVLSAGAWLAARPGSIVVTVFAGLPPNAERLTEWDAACGLRTGDDVVSLRRAEDLRALEYLDATPRWLDFVDHQYTSERPPIDDIADAIRAIADNADVDTLAMPLGFMHADHQRTYDACLRLLEKEPNLAEHWVAWADVPYRARRPDLLDDRLDSLRVRGILADQDTLIESCDVKRAAVAEYRSQLRALGAATRDDVERPEQIYLLRPQ